MKLRREAIREQDRELIHRRLPFTRGHFPFLGMGSVSAKTAPYSANAAYTAPASVAPTPAMAGPNPAANPPDSYPDSYLAGAAWQARLNFHHLMTQFKDDPVGLGKNVLHGLDKALGAVANSTLHAFTYVPFMRAGLEPLGAPVIGDAVYNWSQRVANAPNKFEAGREFAFAVEAGAGAEFAMLGRASRVVPGRGVLPDTAFSSGTSLRSIPPPRSPELGNVSTIQELLDTGMIPGKQGVTLNQRSVVFSDLWKLSEKHNIEFALTKENGVWRLYSGSNNTVATPLTADTRILAHTHPSSTDTPSLNDIVNLSVNYDAKLALNPAANPSPSRVIYGPGLADYTPFWPANR